MTAFDVTLVIFLTAIVVAGVVLRFGHRVWGAVPDIWQGRLERHALLIVCIVLALLVAEFARLWAPGIPPNRSVLRQQFNAAFWANLYSALIASIITGVVVGIIVWFIQDRIARQRERAAMLHAIAIFRQELRAALAYPDEAAIGEDPDTLAWQSALAAAMLAQTQPLVRCCAFVSETRSELHVVDQHLQAFREFRHAARRVYPRAVDLVRVLSRDPSITEEIEAQRRQFVLARLAGNDEGMMIFLRDDDAQFAELVATFGLFMKDPRIEEVRSAFLHARDKLQESTKNLRAVFDEEGED